MVKNKGATGAVIGLVVATWSTQSHAVNLLENSSFDSGTLGWEVPGWWAGGSGTTVVTDGRLCTTVDVPDAFDWGAQLRQTGLTFYEGAPYTLRFKAWFSGSGTAVPVQVVDEAVGVWDLLQAYPWVDAPLDGPPNEIEAFLVAGADSTVANFRMLFGGGVVPAGQTICVDDVTLDGPLDIVENGSFDANSAGWDVGFWGGTGTYTDGGGRVCLNVESGSANDWEVQFRQADLPVTAGREYLYRADVWTSAPGVVHLSGMDEMNGYVGYFDDAPLVDAPLDGAPHRISGSFFPVATTETMNLRFLLGGGNVPDGTTVCFDNVHLLDPEAAPPPGEPPPPPIHVNQTGYLPHLSKVATYALPAGAPDAATPRAWSLLQEGTIVTSGMTLPFGYDEASGDVVHHVDFSGVTTPGSYVLAVEEAGTLIESFPFEIGAAIYSELKYDALSYFYHARSGEEILASVVGDEYARPAGHLGDASVELYSCRGEADCPIVSAPGGWYDAGDHGKYVVNGGISVWTLLSEYERARFLGSSVGALGDGKLALPEDEQGNGIPDLLDEARVELEWFLDMQVTCGPEAGLVYHKLHDLEWTGLPMAPHDDPQPRFVYPPSTAATLNAAAVFAQAARVWEKFDPAFSETCLEAAESAYAAALLYPDLLAPSTSVGGGTYDDWRVADEFYWAAVELYITTGDSVYLGDLEESEYFLSVHADESSAMGWQSTAGLGTISLATVGEWFGRDDGLVREARAAITGVADTYLARLVGGYPSTLDPWAYYWGSNSFVLNNMIALALAQDFTCDPSYGEGAHQAAAYLLGENPLGTSYVSGYGENAIEQPHHRFFAHVLNPTYPVVPAGTVSGGPNTGLQDPVAQGLAGCFAQRCFLDDINAWSLNEMTVNWNAPLAWSTAYLDELGGDDTRALAEQRCLGRERHFLSFEDPTKPWSSSGSPITVVDDATDGVKGLSVKGPGYTWVNAPLFTKSDVEIIGDVIAIDVKLSTKQSNPWWLGDLSGFISVEGTKQQMQYLGWRSFAGRPLGEWFTVTFPLTPQLQAAILSGKKVKLQFTPNTNNKLGPILLDNVRFTGNILTR